MRPITSTLILGSIAVSAAAQQAPGPEPRGGSAVTLEPVKVNEDFQSHPLSTDPVFDRFQVMPGEGQVDPAFAWELFNGFHAIPSLFVDGQTDTNGTPDPLPRWQGVTLQQTGNPLPADINGDGTVDTADLGLLISQFGQSGAGLSADLNSDGAVDTADLGALIGAFGASLGPQCVYEVTQVYAFDDAGDPLPPGTLDNGPFISDRFGFASSPACGACDTFTFTQSGTGINIIGEWTLINLAAPNVGGVSFFGEEVSFGCDGWGDERVLALVRGETEAPAEYDFSLMISGDVVGDDLIVYESNQTPLVCEVDVFLTSHEAVHWSGFYSEFEQRPMSWIQTGGDGDDYPWGYGPFSNGDGLLDRFVITSKECPDLTCFQPGNWCTGPDPDYPGFGLDPATALPGKNTLAGEWFTVRHVVTTDRHHEVWIRDSETMAMTDPVPGDDGGSTPGILDDIEDGFARIFPSGPFGRTQAFQGHYIFSPTPPLTTTVTRFEAGYGRENGALAPTDRNSFVDNIRISGVRPIITPPPLTLPYTDDTSTYYEGPTNYSSGGRWTDGGLNETVIDPGGPGCIFCGIAHKTEVFDSVYRQSHRTELPAAVAAPGQPLELTVELKADNTTIARGITPTNTATGEDVVTVLLGVEVPFSDPGVMLYEPGGFTRLHVRQPNPHFDPGQPVDAWGFDWAPPSGFPGDPGYPNIEFINVPTGVLLDDLGVFVPLEFEVHDDGTLRMFFNGAELLPNDPDRFYTAAPGDLTRFSPGSIGIDRLRFGCGHQAGSHFVELRVRLVTLTGAPAP